MSSENLLLFEKHCQTAQKVTEYCSETMFFKEKADRDREEIETPIFVGSLPCPAVLSLNDTIYQHSLDHGWQRYHRGTFARWTSAPPSASPLPAAQPKRLSLLSPLYEAGDMTSQLSQVFPHLLLLKQRGFSSLFDFGSCGVATREP